MVAANFIPRFVCAGILLVAASLKGYQLATDPTLGTLHGSRWLQLLLVEYEVVLASWLLSGIAQRPCRWVALATFASFGCYAFYLGVTGAASCGCFGGAIVDPWWTFGLDVAALLPLWRWWPVAASMGWIQLIRTTTLPAAVGSILLVAIAKQPSAALADGIVMGESFVLLEPEKWVGKQFPLIELIDIGEKFEQGAWKLLFYHHDCPKCQEALGRRSNEFQDRPFRAVIEVPPFGQDLPQFAHRGRLTESKDWFVTTPVEISLDNGRVVAVSYEGEVLSKQTHETVFQ